MSGSSAQGRVWLIDRQDYLENLAGDLLRREGFEVRPFCENPSLFSAPHSPADGPDLVVLGCAYVGDRERRLLARMVEQGLQVLLLVESLSVGDLRDLFRAGARDVDRLPDEPNQFLEDIRKNINAISEEKTRPKVWSMAAM